MSERSIGQDRFVVLVARHERRVRAFLAAVLRMDHDDVDECLQSTLLIAWQKVRTFTYKELSPDEEFVRWLCTIAKYEAQSLRRKRFRDTNEVFDDQLFEKISRVGLEETFYLEARHQALLACLAKLKEGDREFLSMRYSGGSSMREVAAVMGLSEGSVRVRFARLRKTLGRCIGHALIAEGYTHGA